MSIPSQGNGANLALLAPAPSADTRPEPPPEDPKKPFKKSAAFKYMECLKNHAAAIGGGATDGCGEFLAGGEEGSLEALKCSACNCHRNFHRKISIQPEPSWFGVKNSVYGSGPELGLGLGQKRNPQEGEVRKRFRTKFTQEQKEKMLSFAEKNGWKIQKMDDSEVRKLCQEIGIQRKVLKVWMHNNKYHIAKKSNKTS